MSKNINAFFAFEVIYHNTIPNKNIIQHDIIWATIIVTNVLKVKPDGSAHVKKVVFKKPEQVDVLGSISVQKKRSNTYLRNSVNRMRPIAAQKILKTAR